MAKLIHHTMLYAEHKTWHKALICDDVVALKEYLETSSETDKLCLINGRFDYQDHTLDGLQVSGTLAEIRKCTYPFTIAVFYGSWKVVSALLEEGVDPLVQEEHEENILHLLVVLAAENLRPEENALKTYATLMGMLSVELKRALLHAENGIHQRPIEYAANRGTIQLLRAMFDTNGVYRVAELDIGMIKYIKYDITEYETTAERMRKSPLYFLSISTETTFLNPQFGEFLEWTPVKQWCKAKQLISIGPLALWLIARILMIALFHIIVLNHLPSDIITPDSRQTSTEYTTEQLSDLVIQNISQQKFCHETSHTSSINMNRYILLYVAIVHSVILIIMDIWEIISSRSADQRMILSGKQSERLMYLINITHRVSQHFTLWNLVGLYILLLLGYDMKGNIWIGLLTFSAFLEIYFCSLAYLFIFPSIGLHIVIIYRISIQLAYFCLLLLTMMLPFAYFFMTFVSVNSTQGCVEDFQNIWYSIYTTIRIMLNMIDITGYDVLNKGLLLVTHTVCVFIIAIMMINFLIAIMTNTAGTLMEHRHVIQNLITIWMSLQTEIRRSHIIGYYSKKLRPKYMKCEDGRVYVFDVCYLD